MINDIPLGMLKIFAIVGFGVVIGFVTIIVVGIFYAIGNLCNNIVLNYKIKHRFDKPPKAKCYCKDCKNYDMENSQSCMVLHLYGLKQDWFCKDAKPRDPEERG